MTYILSSNDTHLYIHNFRNVDTLHSNVVIGKRKFIFSIV